MGLPFWQPVDCCVQFDIDFVMKCWLIKYLSIYDCAMETNGKVVINRNVFFKHTGQHWTRQSRIAYMPISTCKTNSIERLTKEGFD